MNQALIEFISTFAGPVFDGLDAHAAEFFAVHTGRDVRHLARTQDRVRFRAGEGAPVGGEPRIVRDAIKSTQRCQAACEHQDSQSQDLAHGIEGVFPRLQARRFGPIQEFVHGPGFRVRILGGFRGSNPRSLLFFAFRDGLAQGANQTNKA